LDELTIIIKMWRKNYEQGAIVTRPFFNDQIVKTAKPVLMRQILHIFF